MIDPKLPLKQNISLNLAREALKAYRQNLQIELGKNLMKLAQCIEDERSATCSDDRMADAREGVLWVTEEIYFIDEVLYTGPLLASIMDK